MNKNKHKYHGITYFNFLSSEAIRKFWKKFYCKQNIHLFDECLSEEHYLHCDACGLSVYIDRIEKPKELIR